MIPLDQRRRNELLIEIYSTFVTQDASKLVSECRDFLWVYNNLQNAIYLGKSLIQPWQEQLEILCAKFGSLCNALTQLVEGTNMQTLERGKTAQSYDITSVYVLTRAVIETYFTIYYLNFEISDNVDRCMFRNDLYKYSGFARRQEFLVDTDGGRRKLAFEKTQMEELLERINNNEYFISLSSEKRKRLISKKEAREYSWYEMINCRKLKKDQTATLWKLLSNHAHSEYIGTIQFRDYINNLHSLKSVVFHNFFKPISILAVLIQDIRTHFKSADIVYNTLDKEVTFKIDFVAKMYTAQ